MQNLLLELLCYFYLVESTGGVGQEDRWVLDGHSLIGAHWTANEYYSLSSHWAAIE